MSVWKFIENAKVVTPIIATIFIPIVVALVVNSYSNAIKEKEISVRYVELAIKILMEQPKQEEENEKIREWAARIINNYSNVPLDERTFQYLIDKPLFEDSDYLSYSYSDDHYLAVAGFILSTEKGSEQRIRLSNFKQFFNSIKGCTTVECIEAQIYNNITLPGFREEYENWHQYAERSNIQFAPSHKAELILYGFRSDIDKFEIMLSK